MTPRIRIRPKTNRLRQLIRDHGDVWEMTQSGRVIPCMPGQRAIEIRSLNHRHTRWIDIEHTRPLIQKDD